MGDESLNYTDYIPREHNELIVDVSLSGAEKTPTKTVELLEKKFGSNQNARREESTKAEIDPSKSTEESSLLNDDGRCNSSPLNQVSKRREGISEGIFNSRRYRRMLVTPSAAGEFSMMGSIPEEGSDEEDEDMIMEAMDYLEDEIDGHTYDELIPLHIRMALEDQIFGWDHFLSNILGHVSYTVGSYLLTFWIVTYIVLREVPWGQYDESDQPNPWHLPRGVFSFVRTAISLTSAVSTFRTIRRRRRVWLRQPYGSSQRLTGAEAERRKMSLREADQRAKRFVLGSKLWTKLQRTYLRGRDSYLARRVNRKMLKAQKMFERRHKTRMKLIRSASNSSLLSRSDSGQKADSEKRRQVASALTRHTHESSHHDRVKMLASTGGRRRNNESGCTSGDDDASISADGLSTASSYTISDYHSFLPGHAKNGLTLPHFAMESVSHDQMPFAHGEIKNIPYVHGGFFGAAPFMLTNPHWIGILRILMPDVYVEISRRALYAPAPKLIHWAENNPVVAAYGTAHELEFSGRVPTLEWDIFLDPYLIRRVEIVLNEKESFIKRQQEARRKSNMPSESDERNNGDAHMNDELERDSQPASYANERLVLKYYDTEIRRRTAILVDRMLIAHGNVAQLIIEQTGWLKKYNFSRVKRTRKTLGGGIFARQWLAVYSEAMKLGLGVDHVETGSNDSESEESLDPGDTNEKLCGLNKTVRAGPPKKIYMKRNSTIEDDDDMSTDGSTASEQSPQKNSRTRREKIRRHRARVNGETAERNCDKILPTSLNQASVCPDKTIHESISLLRNIIQCSAPIGLLLDMKSRHVSRRVWALVIDLLREFGARVEGIASFFVEEVRDISQYCSCSVNEIIFFHSAGDMQLSCNKGLVKRGDMVFFNAGSLLWDYPNIYDVAEVKKILLHRFHPFFDGELIKERYCLKPYARVAKRHRSNSKNASDDESETCDESTANDADSAMSDLFTKLIRADCSGQFQGGDPDFVYEETADGICSTVQDYKEHYGLSIGLYVQEFAIDEAAISLIVKYVNCNPQVYDLGLSWGGINGLTVKGIQPGRFTATDGLWNQRYGGYPWRKDLKPSDVV